MTSPDDSLSEGTPHTKHYKEYKGQNSYTPLLALTLILVIIIVGFAIAEPITSPSPPNKKIKSAQPQNPHEAPLPPPAAITPPPSRPQMNPHPLMKQSATYQDPDFVYHPGNATFYQYLNGTMLIRNVGTYNFTLRNVYQRIRTGDSPAVIGNLDLDNETRLLIQSTVSAIRVINGTVYIHTWTQETVIITVTAHVTITINSTHATAYVSTGLGDALLAVNLTGNSEHGINYNGVFNLTLIGLNDDWVTIYNYISILGIMTYDVEGKLDGDYDTPKNNTLCWIEIAPNTEMEAWVEYMCIPYNQSEGYHLGINMTNAIIEMEAVKQKVVDEYSVKIDDPSNKNVSASLNPYGYVMIDVDKDASE
ncbi:MAG: hypothetical protein ACTSXJ_11320, partial [Candidatus Baldrarchaeia archaeon]